MVRCVVNCKFHAHAVLQWLDAELVLQRYVVGFGTMPRVIMSHLPRKVCCHLRVQYAVAYALSTSIRELVESRVHVLDASDDHCSHGSGHHHRSVNFSWWYVVCLVIYSRQRDEAIFNATQHSACVTQLCKSVEASNLQTSVVRWSQFSVCLVMEHVLARK
jgi:hypothetical protein